MQIPDESKRLRRDLTDRAFHPTEIASARSLSCPLFATISISHRKSMAESEIKVVMENSLCASTPRNLNLGNLSVILLTVPIFRCIARQILTVPRSKQTSNQFFLSNFPSFFRPFRFGGPFFRVRDLRIRLNNLHGNSFMPGKKKIPLPCGKRKN